MATVRKRGHIWYVYYSLHGKRHAKAVSSLKSDAVQVAAEIDRRIRQGHFPMLGELGLSNITFKEVCEDFMGYAKDNKKSWKRDELSIKHFSDFFSPEIKIDHITPALINQYKQERRQTVSPGTVNRELACLKTIFNLATQNDKALFNPVRKVKFYREPQGRLRFLSKTEAQQLVRACNSIIRPLVIIALYTGMRRGEILNLCWQDIDWENRVIWVREGKSGKGRYVPLLPSVANVFRDVRKTGEKMFTGHNHRRHFEKAVKQAGLVDCTFHTLRHTSASWLVMEGVDLNTVRELLGHSTYRMTLRYAHLSPKHKANAVQVLEQYKMEEDDRNVTTVLKVTKGIVRNQLKNK